LPVVSFSTVAIAQDLVPADPALRGPYAVGVTRRIFTRESSTTGEPRVLNTVVWYPAVAGSEGPEPPLGRVLAEPDRSGAPYPVLVFSHGFRGGALDSGFLHTHLASHGFVVVAPYHPQTVVPSGCPASQEPPTLTSAGTDRGENDDSLPYRPV